MSDHKFFDEILDNDLDELFKYLRQQKDLLLNGNFPGITKDIVDQKEEEYGFVSTTQLGYYYNIFKLNHPSVNKLKESLQRLVKEAAYHYGVENIKDMYVSGWFNFDSSLHDSPQEIDLLDTSQFHDHSGGTGSPQFHGYYCVNAEPSSTFYHINRDVNLLFENKNINNRVIVSETGHPHRIGSWSSKKPRVTIAYDISPYDSIKKEIVHLWTPLYE